MFPKSDLHLLRDALSRLTETPYFHKELEKYTRGLIRVISHVLSGAPKYSDAVVSKFSQCIWRAHVYLRGSISREVPYELQYALGLAVNEWVREKFVIAMALRDEKDFHFFSLDVWRFIKSILPDFSYPEFDSILIQIALPRSYREKPIFNIPLYHELGHFVDTHYQISKLSFLSLPPFSRNPKQEESHRREYFADLFAAQYVGDANWKSLEAHVGQAGASLTHPSSADRRSIAQLFLSGASVPLIDAFQAALRRQNAPELKRRFSMPNLNSTFDNMRPYELRSPAELHGLFAAGWDYFDTARRAPAGTWMSMDEASLERIINDLAEKSIRNMSIREKWGYAAAP